MKSIIYFLFSFLSISSTVFCQKSHTYNWSWDTDGGILASSFLGLVGTNYVANQVKSPTVADLEYLDYNSLPFFDRGAVFNNSLKAAEISDVFLFGSLALPLATYLDRRSTGQKGAILGMMFETLLINTNITTAIKASTTRFRPYAYSFYEHESLSLSSNTRQSFISGHTSTVAATSFFTAKVLTDLHPNSKLKPLIWASAVLVPAATGYLRYKAGRHFPSDIVAGYGIGAFIGYMVPHLHRWDSHPRFNMAVLPIPGGLGASLDINLNTRREQSEFITF